VATIKLRGRITDEGKLEVELPSEVAPGEVEITVAHVESYEWSPAEREELILMLRGNPVPADEITLPENSSWAQKGITDPVEFVESLRREEEAQRARRDD